LWKGRELHDLYKEAHTPWDWHEPIFAHAKKRGVIAFSSPFDETAVDFLEKLNVPAYKIASFENTDHTLIKKIATTNKPVIMSTGVSSLADIDESVQLLRKYQCGNFALLKCTSTYPSTPENTNLFTIPHMSKLFNCPVGLSDHTMGIGAAVAAIALGARIIEKHFTLSRAEGGVDSAFSLEPDELKSLVIETERAFLSLGSIQYGIQKAEEKSKQFKRSLYIVEDIKQGELLTAENIQSKRPGFGLHTRHYEGIINKKARTDLKKGEPLKWEHLE
jgi:N-acetylneuraminate synthase